MIDNHAAITTRVAPSFLRVGQLELFARRVRNNSHNDAFNELKIIVQHLIDRNYKKDIDPGKSFNEKVINLAYLYRERLISLVTNWIRVGYCQGNFNSDNCAAGGYTLDYGPFGFCELFDPRFQPWTGGGEHFSFLNQPFAAEINFKMFCTSLGPLLLGNNEDMEKLEQIKNDFSKLMGKEMQLMWARKLGLEKYNKTLTNDLLNLMVISKADFTIFFRKLSHIPENISFLEESLYLSPTEKLLKKWNIWLTKWHDCIKKNNNIKEISISMKQVNPKFTWREWMIVPAYEEAEEGNYNLIKELQSNLSNPYEEQSSEMSQKYNRLRPREFFNNGGISHYSCSS